ncbi:ABC transporter ATP-binding protein [soil metagenome]
MSTPVPPSESSIASSKTPVITTTGLTKRYGDVTAVQGLDLTINQGEVYGFLGRNGAGKTTTMRVLLGLIRPTAGTAVVMGHPPGDPDGLAQLGALVEAPAFYPYLSGRDNLKLLARYAGVATTTIDEALEEVGLAERSGEKVKGYSMGTRQPGGCRDVVETAFVADPRRTHQRLGPPGHGQHADVHPGSWSRRPDGDAVQPPAGRGQQVCDRVGVIEGGRLVAEGTVDELRGAAGIRIRATPTELAATIVGDVVGRDNVSVRDDVLDVTVDPGQAAQLNRRLVEGASRSVS